MPRPHLIGIAGLSRVGKDTLASFIISNYGGYRYSFADPIRDMLRVLGIDMDQPYWQTRKEEVIPALGVSPRRMMQTLGTEWGRQLIHEDIWLTMARQRLASLGPGMVVPDIRFENEAGWIRQQGGIVIHLSRDGEANASKNGVEHADTDLLVKNDGTLEDLQHLVSQLFDGDHKA